MLLKWNMESILALEPESVNLSADFATYHLLKYLIPLSFSFFLFKIRIVYLFMYLWYVSWMHMCACTCAYMCTHTHTEGKKKKAKLGKFQDKKYTEIGGWLGLREMGRYWPQRNLFHTRFVTPFHFSKCIFSNELSVRQHSETDMVWEKWMLTIPFHRWNNRRYLCSS